MTTPVLLACKIKKVYPGPEPLEVLKEVSLDVAPGDTIASGFSVAPGVGSLYSYQLVRLPFSNVSMTAAAA